MYVRRWKTPLQLRHSVYNSYPSEATAIRLSAWKLTNNIQHLLLLYDDCAVPSFFWTCLQLMITHRYPTSPHSTGNTAAIVSVIFVGVSVGAAPTVPSGAEDSTAVTKRKKEVPDDDTEDIYAAAVDPELHAHPPWRDAAAPVIVVQHLVPMWPFDAPREIEYPSLCATLRWSRPLERRTIWRRRWEPFITNRAWGRWRLAYTRAPQRGILDATARPSIQNQGDRLPSWVYHGFQRYLRTRIIFQQTASKRRKWPRGACLRRDRSKWNQRASSCLHKQVPRASRL